MRSKACLVGRAAALVLVGAAWGGCSQPQVHATVIGSVVDGLTERPVAGVAVSSHGATATTDLDGHYHLDVTVGVRELAFALPDGRSLRKTPSRGTPATSGSICWSPVPMPAHSPG